MVMKYTVQIRRFESFFFHHRSTASYYADLADIIMDTKKNNKVIESLSPSRIFLATFEMIVEKFGEVFISAKELVKEIYEEYNKFYYAMNNHLAEEADEIVATLTTDEPWVIKVKSLPMPAYLAILLYEAEGLNRLLVMAEIISKIGGHAIEMLAEKYGVINKEEGGEGNEH